jgi:transposase
MSETDLFGDLMEQPAPKPATGPGAPRVQEPRRDEPSWQVVDLDALIAPDHPARLVWSFVTSLELDELYASIKACAHTVGRTPIDPRLLLALWLYAVIDGVGSAREIERLCGRDLVYRWLCGGVSVNHHTLSDFRIDHEAVLDRLLTDSVTVLVSDGLISLERLAQDGVRVRASAGAASFRRRDRLTTLRAEMAERIEQLKSEPESDAAAGRRRKQAARLRAAAGREERCRKALVRLRELEIERERRPAGGGSKDKPGAVRASTTDAEARVMKMPDGGFRPAYNVQVAGDPDTQVIVGIAIDTRGSDAGQLRPMLEQLRDRYGRTPSWYLADGGFCGFADIEWAWANGTAAVIPADRGRNGRDPSAPRPGDGPGVTVWRELMSGALGQRMYRVRSQLECLFAQMRRRDLRQLPVRGSRKVRCVMLLHALAHNLLCAARLRAQAA